MKISCNKITGFVTGKNSRNRIPELTEKGYIGFSSELERDAEGNIIDDRNTLYDLVYGEKADDKSKKRFLDLIKAHDSTGADSTWALAHSFLKFEQRQPCTVRKDKDEYKLIGGFGRWLGAITAHLLNPTFNDEVTVDVVDVKDEDAMELGTILNLTSRKMRPSEEGKVYFDLKKKEKMSNKEVAEHLGVYDKHGKLNVVRIQMYSDLWHNAVTDKDRSGVDNGSKSMDSVIKKVKESRQGERDKTGKAGPKGRKSKKLKTLKYESLAEVIKNDDIINYFENEKKFDNYGDAIRFGINIALGKEAIPTDNELKAMMELEEAIV